MNPEPRQLIDGRWAIFFAGFWWTDDGWGRMDRALTFCSRRRAAKYMKSEIIIDLP
jgi:hypothetical protein